MLSNLLAIALLGFAFTALTLSEANAAGTAEVKVSRQESPSRVTYYYRVMNNSPNVITTVEIGFNSEAGIVPELIEKPIGWSPSDPTTINAGSSTSPEGWTAELINVEDTNNIALRFDLAPYDLNKAIKPGQSLSGFSVSIPKRDDTYSSSHFSLSIVGGTDMNGLITQDAQDTTPPTLSVGLSPNVIWPPNNKMVSVNAVVQVRDDRDPNPKVKLVSITCDDNCSIPKDVSGAQLGSDDRSFSVKATRSGNAKKGRTYKVTYSATDFTGNTSIKTLDVIVPHDQGITQ